jgi:hypothetical protein
MGAHLLRRIAFIKARGEWPNSRLAQHLTRGIIAVITARFDRLSSEGHCLHSKVRLDNHQDHHLSITTYSIISILQVKLFHIVTSPVSLF